MRSQKRKTEALLLEEEQHLKDVQAELERRGSLVEAAKKGCEIRELQLARLPAAKLAKMVTKAEADLAQVEAVAARLEEELAHERDEKEHLRREIEKLEQAGRQAKAMETKEKEGLHEFIKGLQAQEKEAEEAQRAERARCASLR